MSEQYTLSDIKTALIMGCAMPNEQDASEALDYWIEAHDKKQASNYPSITFMFDRGRFLSDEDIDRLAYEVLKARQAADGFDLAAHDKEVLGKAVERADRALDRYFEDYRIEGQRAVLAAIRGEGERE